ncbi:unnamed protein product [Brachionus calyciflorus]|uniref:Uncharacterized protein n=1 Tax=Brachionus calyciflorus TaxID=104777 RepID=A0A814D353_9BILA|nr:unnamed protein product [Brachionus calyciflorus]
MKYNTNAVKKGRVYEISMFGSELSRFINFIKEYQRHDLIQNCSSDCVFNKANVLSQDSDLIYFKKINNNVRLYSGYTENCEKGGGNILTEIRFTVHPTFLLIQSANNNIFIHEIPKKIKVNGFSFRLLCTTFHKRAHFVAIYLLNNNFYIVDDLNKSAALLKPFDITLKTHGNSKEYSYYKKLMTTVSFYILES